MNRDELAALARGTVTVIAGAAVMLAIGNFLGWWPVGLIVAAAIGDYIRCALALR